MKEANLVKNAIQIQCHHRVAIAPRRNI